MGNTFYPPFVDPWNGDNIPEYFQVQSVTKGGGFADVTVKASSNYPHATPTRYFVELPMAIDISDLAGAMPIIITDESLGPTTLTRVSSAPGVNEYRVPVATSSWRNVIEVNAASAGDILSYDYYGLKSIIDAEAANTMITIKGFLALDLTGYTTTAVPTIAANSHVEINGSLYNNPSAVAITGSTSNDTWYDILLTPSGTSFTASYIARGTGAWSASLQGLYAGTNRVVACVYRVGATNFINKNILIVDNRTVKIKLEIGDWNMVSTGFINVKHGITPWANIRNVDIFIIDDGATVMFQIYRAIYSGSFAGWYKILPATIELYRDAGGQYDNTSYDSTSYNRGWIPIEYEV